MDLSDRGNSIFPILLVNFIGTLGYSIVLPFLVVVVINFGGNELIYGIMGASYSFFQLIGAPILGKWSDRVGRRKILLLSQGGTFLAWVIFLVAMLLPNETLTSVDTPVLGSFTVTVPLLLLFLSRALDGITGGNVSVANAYLADISDDSNRKKNFGQMSASGNLGFIVGPAAAGILGATVLGDILPVGLALVISFVAILVISFNLKEQNPCLLKKAVEVDNTRKVLGQEHKECHEMQNGSMSLWEVMKLPKVPGALIIYFLIFLAFSFFYVAFPVHAVQTLNWSVFRIGIFFTVMSGVLVLVQGPLLSYFSKKFSDGQLFFTGNLILAAGFYAFTVQTDVVIFAGVVLFALGNGIMWPSFLSMLAGVAGEKYQGAIQGFASSSGSLASILGLIGGGVVYGQLNSSIFIIPAALIVIIALVFFFSDRDSR